MIKKAVVIAALLLTAFSCLSVAFAEGAGIRGEIVHLNFKPGLEYSATYYLFGANNLRAYLSGDLKEYGQLIDPAPDSGPRQITVYLKLPQEIEEPGQHMLTVGALQLNKGGSGASGVSAVEYPIYVEVPYPGDYVLFSVSTPNINVNETLPISLAVNNKGKNGINSAYANVDILLNGIKINSLSTEKKAIASQEKAGFDIRLDTAGMAPDNYEAYATLYYDNGQKKANSTFRIGNLFVDIVNSTEKFEVNKIAKLDVSIESFWNSRIDDVYAEINIGNEKIKTPSEALEPWAIKVLSTYWDTNGKLPGIYNATITVFYHGQQTSKDARFEIVEHIEEEKEASFLGQFSTAGIILVIIILLVIFDIAWLRARNRKKENQEKGLNQTREAKKRRE